MSRGPVEGKRGIGNKEGREFEKKDKSNYVLTRFGPCSERAHSGAQTEISIKIVGLEFPQGSSIILLTQVVILGAWPPLPLSAHAQSKREAFGKRKGGVLKKREEI